MKTLAVCPGGCGWPAYSATSFVVQHGAPCCRFGFAPLAADRFLAWGPSSAEQLTRWAVPAERIQVVGSPHHDQLRGQLAKLAAASSSRSASRSVKILLVATAPPRDDRPDAVGLHMTCRIRRDASRAVTAIAAIPRARLVVKLHPRVPHDPILKKLLAARHA